MIHLFDPTAQSGTQWSWLTISGRDARDFLHRLTTVHVNALQVGQGAPGFFLSSQGKVRAYFSLWRFGEEDFAFEFDAGSGHGQWKKELLATIDQYTFAEKFALADLSELGSGSPLSSRWLLADKADETALLAAAGAPALKPGETLALDEEIRVCHHGSIDFGRTWISVWGRTARLNQWMDRAFPGATPLRADELALLRIEALRPWVGTEITDATIPLEAGLVDALAQGKGCYPGQEVIERIAALGSPARRLVRIEGSGDAPAPGTPIHNLAEPPAEVGQLTSVASRAAGGYVALGFVRKIHAKEGLEVNLGSGARGSITSVAPYA